MDVPFSLYALLPGVIRGLIHGLPHAQISAELRHITQWPGCHL